MKPSKAFLSRWRIYRFCLPERVRCFTRKNLIEREEEQKERLIAQLETDLANISLSAGSGETALKSKIRSRQFAFQAERLKVNGKTRS